MLHHFSPATHFHCILKSLHQQTGLCAEAGWLTAYSSSHCYATGVGVLYFYPELQQNNLQLVRYLQSRPCLLCVLACVCGITGRGRCRVGLCCARSPGHSQLQQLWGLELDLPSTPPLVPDRQPLCLITLLERGLGKQPFPQSTSSSPLGEPGMKTRATTLQPSKESLGWC